MMRVAICYHILAPKRLLNDLNGAGGRQETDAGAVVLEKRPVHFASSGTSGTLPWGPEGMLCAGWFN